MTAKSNRGDVLSAERWQDEPVSHVDAELVTAAASSPMAVQPCVEAVRRVSRRCSCCYSPSRHADVNEPAIPVPDRVNASAEPRDFGVRPVAEPVSIPSASAEICSDKTATLSVSSRRRLAERPTPLARRQLGCYENFKTLRTQSHHIGAVRCVGSSLSSRHCYCSEFLS